MEYIHKIQQLFKFSFIIIGILFSEGLKAQEYPVSNIPDSLKQDAIAVVRYESEHFIQSDINSGKYLVTKVITVLNQDGKDYADFSYPGDKFREVSSFSGVIYNAFGKEIKKIKKGDLSTSSLNLESYSVNDGHTVFYNYTPPTYPYTIKYKYEVKFKNGLLSYPLYMPISYPSVSVEKSEYILDIPNTVKLRHKENYKSNISKKETDNRYIYSLSTSNKKAIPSEKKMPIYEEIYPMVYLAPTNICYDSYNGDMSDWKQFGLWNSELLKGRDELPEKVKATAMQLTANAKDDKEKVKILYEYMQGKTRYFYVRYGIGGYQPLSADFVAKNNYGDCKALSNYMKALLKSVGIISYYTVIAMEKKDIYADYPNFYQADHAILSVPMQNDTIWLECTSQKLPFGYTHSGIAGHNAILIDEDGSGGKFIRLPIYKDEDSNTTSTLNIDINEDGSALVQFSATEHLNAYDHNVDYIISNDRERQAEYINSSFNLPRIHIGNISTIENRSAKPSCTLKADVEVEDYGNITGSRLFIPICPLNKGNFNLFSAKERVFDINFEEGYYWNDSVIINIPESHVVESLPKDINLNNKFGHFNTSINVEGNKIIYSQKVALYKGRYPNSDYVNLRNFLKQLQNSMKRRVTLKKQ